MRGDLSVTVDAENEVLLGPVTSQLACWLVGGASMDYQYSKLEGRDATLIVRARCTYRQ